MEPVPKQWRRTLHEPLPLQCRVMMVPEQMLERECRQMDQLLQGQELECQQQIQPESRQCRCPTPGGLILVENVAPECQYQF